MRPVAATTALVGVLFLAASLAKRNRAPSGTRQIFQWLDVHECPELKEQNLTCVLRYTKSGAVFADTEWTVVHPAQTISKLRQIILSCRPDGTACEHFMTWNSAMEGCDFVAAKNAFWSPCFDNIRPPFVCPIAAGRYTNMNWTIDNELAQLLPFPRDKRYKDRFEMWNEHNQLTYCFNIEFMWKHFKPRA